MEAAAITKADEKAERNSEIGNHATEIIKTGIARRNTKKCFVLINSYQKFKSTNVDF